MDNLTVRAFWHQEEISPPVRDLISHQNSTEPWQHSRAFDRSQRTETGKRRILAPLNRRILTHLS